MSIEETFGTPGYSDPEEPGVFVGDDGARFQHIDGLDEIDAVLTLPQDRPTRPGAIELEMDVLYGATVGV